MYQSSDPSLLYRCTNINCFLSATVHIKINIMSDVSFYKMNLTELRVPQQFYLPDIDKKKIKFSKVRLL